MAWKGVITNSGSELLAQWTAGKTLTITRAAAGTGRVSEAAMLAQTALVSEKQTVSILSNKTTAQGQKLQLQVTPLATGYPLNQLGIWAKLDSGAARLIALFQTDTDAGVEIPSKTDVPDYVYTFYGLLEFTGSGGTLQVTIDASALVTAESMAAAIKAHNEDENAHEGIRQAITDKQDKITASGVLKGDGKGGVTAQKFDTVPTENSDKLLTSGAVAAALAKRRGWGQTERCRSASSLSTHRAAWPDWERTARLAPASSLSIRRAAWQVSARTGRWTPISSPSTCRTASRRWGQTVSSARTVCRR